MKNLINITSVKSLSFLGLLIIALCLGFPIQGTANPLGVNDAISPGRGEAAPVPDIKVNGQDGPLTITPLDSLAVTVSLNAAGNTGNADWWAVVEAPDGSYFSYDLSSQAVQSGLTVTYQGPLFNLGSSRVSSPPVLSRGTYIFYFGVDFTVDGAVTLGSLAYDSVVVNVSNPTIRDIDGNVYNTVTIGTQMWMQENLKTTKFRNGDSIPTTTSSSIPNNSSSIYQWAYNDDQSYVSTYGLLYTWYAATDSRGLCPSGWHLPTDTEWTMLENYLGGSSVADGKMKASGTTYWNTPNTGATNSSGFTALPGGYLDYKGNFQFVGNRTFWWSSTIYGPDADYAYMYHLIINYSGAGRGNMIKSSGLSVRCVKY